jgi:clan AA aspartic protease (TIGR02281 family)
MKKITLSGCLTRLLLAVILIMGFVWAFSQLFPRAYDTLEAKALGIKEDSVTTVVQKKDSVPKKLTKNDSIVWKQINSPKLAVKLEHKDNCYIVPVKINGIPMKMLLDTGAASMTISVVEYEFLKRHGSLSEKCVGETECTIADGSVVKAYTTKISEVNIGGEVVKDVECVVMPQTDATSLLGMNVLHKFGNFRIDSKQNLLILKE